MKQEQVIELLLQSLEHEACGMDVYRVLVLDFGWKHQRAYIGLMAEGA